MVFLLPRSPACTCGASKSEEQLLQFTQTPRPRSGGAVENADLASDKWVKPVISDRHENVAVAAADLSGGAAWISDFCPLCGVAAGDAACGAALSTKQIVGDNPHVHAGL